MYSNAKFFDECRKIIDNYLSEIKFPMRFIGCVDSVMINMLFSIVDEFEGNASYLYLTW